MNGRYRGRHIMDIMIRYTVPKYPPIVKTEYIKPTARRIKWKERWKYTDCKYYKYKKV